MANLLYLHQHQLIVSGLKPSSEGYVLVNRPAITTVVLISSATMAD
jgi:hypothetical protein